MAIRQIVTVPATGALGLVGGPVTIAGGTLKAAGGTIRVAAAAGQGEILVDPRNTAAMTVASFAPVSISAASLLDVSDPSGAHDGGSLFLDAAPALFQAAPPVAAMPAVWRSTSPASSRSTAGRRATSPRASTRCRRRARPAMPGRFR
jgi:hypothetical protein